jgi:hypothetical protein
MEIITLPWGIFAPEESDCVHVEEIGEGRWTLNTSALRSCATAEEGQSDATIGSAPYDSYAAAEAAGLAIAAEHCADTVYVSRQRANGG